MKVSFKFLEENNICRLVKTQDVIMAKPKSPPFCTVQQVKKMSHYLNIFLSSFQLTVKNKIKISNVI